MMKVSKIFHRVMVMVAARIQVVAFYLNFFLVMFSICLGPSGSIGGVIGGLSPIERDLRQEELRRDRKAKARSRMVEASRAPQYQRAYR